MVGHIVFLIAASFIPDKPEITNGVICMVWGVVCVVWEYLATKDKDTMVENIKNVDYATMALLAGLFTVIGGIQEQGIITDLADIIAHMGGGNVLLLL